MSIYLTYLNVEADIQLLMDIISAIQFKFGL